MSLPLSTTGVPGFDSADVSAVDRGPRKRCVRSEYVLDGRSCWSVGDGGLECTDGVTEVRG